MVGWLLLVHIHIHVRVRVHVLIQAQVLAPLHLSNFFLIGVLGWQTGSPGGVLHVWQRHNFE